MSERGQIENKERALGRERDGKMAMTHLYELSETAGKKNTHTHVIEMCCLELTPRERDKKSAPSARSLEARRGIVGKTWGIGVGEATKGSAGASGKVFGTVSHVYERQAGRNNVDSSA